MGNKRFDQKKNTNMIRNNTSHSSAYYISVYRNHKLFLSFYRSISFLLLVLLSIFSIIGSRAFRFFLFCLCLSDHIDCAIVAALSVDRISNSYHDDDDRCIIYWLNVKLIFFSFVCHCISVKRISGNNYTKWNLKLLYHLKIITTQYITQSFLFRGMHVYSVCIRRNEEV